jgi:PIN domain nuclease of toxin-antitoxin system
LVSIASLWEISIKTSLNKLILNVSINDIVNLIVENGFEFLPILPGHIIKNNTLEFHHRDPFDRMIIAQGLYEEIVIVGKDEAFDKYHVTRIWK